MKTVKIAEIQDVRFHSLAEIEKEGNAFFRINGLLFHSAMAVDRVDMKRVEGVVQVSVKMTPTQPGLTCAFDIEIPLSSATTSVVFGAANNPIWTRALSKPPCRELSQ
ncbi:hypothetical protein [Rugamonas aquatica]|uniref:Uncharacterized protein n=1 Tax=Rugamonas aquatica TaxID=2743357 RepID=A0A6A7N808_9BURK|nr:hypothetical protein [Rugamonas aquatica]MQA41159.1 hypothetical protein [Rugamonas aquatica]